MKKQIDSVKNITVFEEKEVRRIWHNEQWYFSVTDVVRVLSDSLDVKQYIKKMRARDNELSVNWGTLCTPLVVLSKDGKKREETMSSLQGIFRIIQSISSPRAEPFKQWLARVGQERIEEIQDPERAIVRAKNMYDQKGYSDEWVAKRMRGINIRNTLTDEWKIRGAKEGFDFAILTNEIYQGAFEMTAKEIKQYKSLQNPDNPRDHMNELELILTMLGEAATTELARARNSEGFILLKKDAHDGGRVAGNARKEIEHESGKGVRTKENYKVQSQEKITHKRKYI